MSTSENSSGKASLAIRIVTGLVLLALAIGVVMGLSTFKDKPKVTKPRVLSELVTVDEAKKKDHKLEVRLNGTVEAVKESKVYSQVTGLVSSISENFIAGGVIANKGDLLLTIDDADYRSAKIMADAEVARINAQLSQHDALISQAEVAQANAKLAESQALATVSVDEESVKIARAALDQAKRMIVQAQAAVDLEKTQRDIAIAEWKEYAAKTGKDASKVPPMVAREPQRKDFDAKLASAHAGLTSAQANVSAAKKMVLRSKEAVKVAAGATKSAAQQIKVAQENKKAAATALDAAKENLVKAERNIERCKIVAPFSGRLITTMVNVGTLVSPGQELAHLLSLDRVQARLPVAKDQIAYLNLDVDSEGGIKPMKFELETTIGDYDINVDATVTRISPVVDRGNRSYEIFADIINRAEDGSRPNKVYVLPGTFVKVRVFGRELKNVYEINRAALRSSAPRSIVEQFPNATSFVALASLEKPADLRKPDDAAKSASGDEDKESSEGEEGETSDATKEDSWVDAWITFIPVEIARKEGDLVLVREYQSASKSGGDTKIEGKKIIVSSPEVMTVGMKIRVSKDALK